VRRGWRILIPVKRLTDAKTRIDLDPQMRADLALAMCCDVVAAANNAPNVERVQVISADPRVAAAVRPLGANLREVPVGVRGLNEELAAALAGVPAYRGVAMLMADLPCLTSDLVAEILDAAPLTRASFVSDLADQGTTMLLHPPGIRVAPRFGHRSAIAHGDIATRLSGDQSWVGARRDVDTMNDLASVAQLRCNPVTRSFLRSLPTAMFDATLSGNHAEVTPRGGQTAGQRIGCAVL
jgi:2-phospho-L-lactate/phosphoenolpyruvate guanylyltransferase